MSMQRAGWTATSGLVRHNHRGDQVLTGQLTPGLLLTLLQQGVQSQHEKELAKKWGMDEGMRATFDILRPLVSPMSKRCTVHQKFGIMNVACDGVWTQERALLA